MSGSVKSYEIPSIVFKPMDRPQSQIPAYTNKTERLSIRVGDHKNYIDARKDIECVDNSCNLQKGLSVATWTWIVLIPIVIFVLLIVLAPSFVVEEDPNQTIQLNYSMIILWTIIISIIMWVSLFAFNNCCSKY